MSDPTDSNLQDNTQIPLGKESQYPREYQAELLFAVPRQLKRDELNISSESLPFSGADIWNGYELSWLNQKGKPQVAIAVFTFSANSINIVESKSFKLYLNSINNHHFANWQQVKEVLTQDLSACAQGQVEVELYELDEYNQAFPVQPLNSHCIDDLDIAIEGYDYSPQLLSATNEGLQVSESLHSHLLKSNCLITSQPDWATIQIEYKGQQICQENLLKYLISFRNHNEFHEQCVERVFTDIMRYCKPQELTVYARYTRRGGLDINPYRTNLKHKLIQNQRLSRQ